MLQGVSGNRRFLSRFKDGCEKYITYNQLTVIKVEKIHVDEEPEVPMISVIPDEEVYLENGNIMVSMSCMILLRRMLSIVRRSMRTWNHMWMRRRWNT